ncbi:hypothetical protein C8R43DRAFT_1115252 [Mycena crocata]|nr:hypothetical protein C8R43DRAFT_1115252 [Mycena crocata]
MPSRTSPHGPDLHTSASGPSKPRRTAVPPQFPDPDVAEMDTDSDDENNAALMHFEPRHLSDAWEFNFQPNEPVWIRHNEKWIRGRIFPRSSPKVGTTDKMIYWNVLYQDAFGHKLRRNFAPLLGELKPDTRAVRKLLKEARWL